jgi:N-acyl-D-aspartate/D-glutamate deacylase
LEEPLDYEPDMNDSIAAKASRQGRSGLEYIYDFLLTRGGTSIALWNASNYAGGNLDAVHEMLTDKKTVTGLSDAGAHVRGSGDMALPTFHLTHWARDRSRGPRLSLPFAVHKLSGSLADALDLHDRGRIRVGMRADINVIDHENLALELPYLADDLPTGGLRFLQHSRGYLATTVNGVVTRRFDSDTGERPGSLVRWGSDRGRWLRATSPRPERRGCSVDCPRCQNSTRPGSSPGRIDTLDRQPTASAGIR